MLIAAEDAVPRSWRVKDSWDQSHRLRRAAVVFDEAEGVEVFRARDGVGDDPTAARLSATTTIAILELLS